MKIMKLDQKNLSTLPIGGPREFWTQAKRYVEASGEDWSVIRNPSEERLAWIAYFRHRGWRLPFWERESHRELCVPTQWPEDFDVGYFAPPRLQATKPKRLGHVPADRQAGSRCNIRVRQDAPQYADVKAWANEVYEDPAMRPGTARAGVGGEGLPTVDVCDFKFNSDGSMGISLRAWNMRYVIGRARNVFRGITDEQLRERYAGPIAPRQE